MLFFTNRIVDVAKTNPSAFGTAFRPMDQVLGRATVTGSFDNAGKATWRLSDLHDQEGDDAMLAVLVTLFQGTRPVLLYIHGNNNTPTKAFYRCQRLQDLYGVDVLGFSWTSEGYQPDGNDLSGLSQAQAATDDDENSLEHVKEQKVTKGWIYRKIAHYRQAKANAQDSTRALARFLRLVNIARNYANKQPLTVAVHSLGCHLLQKAIEMEGVQSSLASATNVLLLAACTSRSKHASWAGKINPTGQLFITYNQGDTVLAGANVADSGDIKLGVNPGDEKVRSPKVRYIDFEGSRTGAGGHGYFVAPWGDEPSEASYKLFKKLFTAQPDFEPGQWPTIYPVGCNESRTVCYMGNAVPGGGNNNVG
jgi:hypothetical protein